jgi:hypothetical protein
MRSVGAPLLFLLRVVKILLSTKEHCFIDTALTLMPFVDILPQLPPSILRCCQNRRLSLDLGKLSRSINMKHFSNGMEWAGLLAVGNKYYVLTAIVVMSVMQRY